jgi:hypothetical protein
MNPCLDCKIFMVNKAKQWIVENDFDFIITGEVIGQRPMSQTKSKMPIVAKQSGADDLLLRPMCAKNLPATKPEIEGWVDREKLHDITGRSRKPQFEMAKRMGIDDYSQPAGGCCFLTDKYYSAKLVDLWQSQGSKDYELDDIMLLKVGRHIRPKANFKLIIAREEGEGRFLQGYKKDFISMHCVSHTGPLALVDGTLSAEDLYFAASIVARYGQGRNEGQVDINVIDMDGSERIIQVRPLGEEEILKEWHV